VDQDLHEHRASFDRHYGGHITPNRMSFPLADIDGLDWRRGPHANEYFAYMYRRFSAHILTMLDIEDGMCVLVLGCGVGSDEKNIRHFYPATSIWGVDISVVMLEAAIASGAPANFAQAPAEHLPFPDACFDRVVSREVIEHVLDPHKMMGEVARVLKPGGIAVITTENEESLCFRNEPVNRLRRRLAGLLGVSLPDRHTVKDEAPSVREFGAICSAVGLEIERILFDGALYKTLPMLQRRIQGRSLAELAHRLSRLEGNGGLAAELCDQVKFKVRKPRTHSLGSVASVRYTVPGTSDALELDAGAYASASGQVFPIRNGIPHFLPDGASAIGTAVDGRPADKSAEPVGIRRVLAAAYWRLSPLLFDRMWSAILLATARILCWLVGRVHDRYIDGRFASYVRP
jgi:ubiquinone/menaquinone biosynthesis C-methylase UbiE